MKVVKHDLFLSLLYKWWLVFTLLFVFYVCLPIISTKKKKKYRFFSSFQAPIPSYPFTPEKPMQYMFCNDETHLMVMRSKKHTAARTEVSISASGHTIKPTVTEKLLGGQLHQSLEWNFHLRDHEGSLMKQLTERIKQSWKWPMLW